MRHLLRILLLLIVVGGALGGCVPPLDHSAYRAYLAHMPKSILVLPPVNFSANVHASDAFLSTVTMPLAESGYYVYPVAVVDRLFKDNGVAAPGDMQSIPLPKIAEVIGPDAVMYINIKEWTTTNIVLDSTTRVTLEYKLVDTKSGDLLWRRAETYAESSSQSVGGGGGVGSLIAMVVVAQIHSVAAAASDGAFEREAAARANLAAFYDQNFGLLKGSRSPDFAKDQQRMHEVLAKEQAAKNPDKP